MFSNNILTPLLESGNIPADDVKNTHLHKIWCLMLSVVDSLLQKMSSSSALLSGASVFLTMYSNQIKNALDVSGEPDMTRAGLEEVELTTRVFSSLGVSCGLEQIGLGCIARYLMHSRAVLKYCKFLLLHPHLLEDKAAGNAGVKVRLIRLLLIVR
jgi:hypothetical protein